VSHTQLLHGTLLTRTLVYNMVSQKCDALFLIYLFRKMCCCNIGNFSSKLNWDFSLWLNVVSGNQYL